MKENRSAFLLCLGAFCVLCVLAAVFYLERMVNLDMAFQTFLILKSGSLEIQSGRFGAAATQFWPWAAQALGLPLKGVLMAYSLGHVLWPMILCVWCWMIGQWRWALASAVVSTLMTTHTFYWLSEMPQGLAFLCAMFAWMQAKGSMSTFKWWQWPLWLVALWTAFYFHPLVLYAHAFLCLFFVLGNNKGRGWVWMHATAFGTFAILTLLKYKVFKLDWYDAAALQRQAAFRELWPNWFDIESNRVFLEWIKSDYWLLWIVLGLNLGYYLWQKKWLKAALSLIWPISFVLLVNVPFHEGLGQQFYMENLYLPLSVFAAIPLIFDVLFRSVGHSKPRYKEYFLVLILLIISILRILSAHIPWSAKLSWERMVLSETETRTFRKIIYTESQVPMETLKMSWGSPYEFLLLSALKHPDSARCIIVSGSPERYDSTRLKPNLFLGTFKNYPFDELPKRYFNLQDTSRYQRITME